MDQKPTGRASSSEQIFVTSSARRASNTVRRRKSVSYWTDCVVKTALPSCVGVKALLRACPGRFC